MLDAVGEVPRPGQFVVTGAGQVPPYVVVSARMLLSSHRPVALDAEVADTVADLLAGNPCLTLAEAVDVMAIATGTVP